MNNHLPIAKPLNTKQILLGKRNTIKQENGRFWFAFDSTKEGLSNYYQFLDLLKNTWGIDELTFTTIHIAISEAVMNAIDHGNKWDEKKSIYIFARHEEDYYIMTVEDEGEGFNYRRIKNPTDVENRANSGGRGIFIMNYLTENLLYSENGKSVRLLFRKRR